MSGHIADPNATQLQGQPRTAPHRDTVISPKHPCGPYLFSSASFVALERKGEREMGEREHLQYKACGPPLNQLCEPAASHTFIPW